MLNKRATIRKKMYKPVILLLLLSMAVGLLASCGNKEDNKHDNEFTVGFDAEFPPYGYKDDNGEYVGFDLSLAQEVCDRNGWTLVKQPIDWDTKDMEINSGSIDCIWNGFTMTGYEDKYTWSSAYINNSQVVVVKASSDIQTLEDLKGKVVVVQAASSALSAFEGDGASEENKQLASEFKALQQVGDYNSAFMNLEASSVHAICMDMGVAKYEVETRDGEFRILDEYVSKEQYGIGFKLGNTELRNQVEETLQEMLADGTFDRIASEWGLSDSTCLGEEDSDYAIKNEKAVKEQKNFINRVFDIVKQLGKGILATLLIFALTLLFSMPLGLLVCFIRMSKIKVLQVIAKIYISILRGTPLMLQLLVVYFGPYYIFGIDLSYSYRFIAVIIGFSLNYAAYFAEIYRSGIESIPRGQYEAADVMGYSKTQTFCKIVFPQMVRRVMPPVTNEVITLVKDTSLAFALAFSEMFTMAKQVAAADASIMPIFVAGVFYYVFNFIVAWIMERIEKKLSYYQY